MNYITFSSPIGNLKISENNHRICKLELVKNYEEIENDSPLLCETKRQLILYFDSKLKHFDLPLEIGGSSFNKRVLKEILKIEANETISYKKLAANCENQKACRAVATVCANNKLPILIPCHRVIYENGKIGEYVFGTKAKVFLLKLDNSL